MNFKSVLGILFIFFILSPVYAKSYKGAELRTNEYLTYGRFEVNYIPPIGDGILGTFFTYRDNISGVDEWNEIDIEILGRYEDNVQFTTITPGQSIHDGHFFVPFNPHLDYHTYGFEWTPDYVAWFADGVEIYRQTGDHITVMDNGQKLMMNIWVPEYEGWVGEWNPQILPKFAYYDWVSYASYTPDSGNVGTDNNFTFEWKDDFTSWDTTRWAKATHTFQGNLVDFLPDNVVYQDGKMILCLTDDVNTGYTDKIPPYLIWARGHLNTVTAHFSEELDSLSAYTSSNYFISGLTIEEIELLEDKQTIKLKVSSIDTTKTYSLAVLGLKDSSPDQNKQVGQVIPITIAKPLSFPLKINTGGGAIYDEYLADQLWGSTVEYGHMDGRSKDWTAANDIIGTDLDSLYIAELQRAVKYKVRMPDGVYSVKFHFAENEFSESGQRVFELAIEDSLIVGKIDLYSVAGLHTAYDVEVKNIPVHDGIMDIHLHNWVEHSSLNGLTIVQESTAIGEQRTGSVKQFKLFQNYPNPFNPSTKIRYELARSSYIELAIFDTLGRKISTLVNERQGPGNYSIPFIATGLASGIYYYQLTAAGGFKQTAKMLLLN